MCPSVAWSSMDEHVEVAARQQENIRRVREYLQQVGENLVRLEESISVLNGALLDEEKELQAIIEGVRIRTLSRETLENVWSKLSDNEENGVAPNEIAPIVELHVATVKNALMQLIMEGRAYRRRIFNLEDSSKGGYVYWRNNKPAPVESSLLSEPEKSIEPQDILNLIPVGRDNAVGIHEIAVKLDVPRSTIRDHCAKLHEEGRIWITKGKNHRNQKTTQYFIPAEGENPDESLEGPNKFISKYPKVAKKVN
jgi:predicted transcriptional regulator